MKYPIIAPFVFFAILFTYTSQRFYKLKTSKEMLLTPRLVWMKENKYFVSGILVFGGLGLLYFGIPLFFKSRFSMIILSFAALVSLLYVVRIRKRSWREIPVLKIFLVVVTFWLVTCVLPFEVTRIKESKGLWVLLEMILFLTQMVILWLVLLYIFGLTILFDIPDLVWDTPTQRTIPQMIGVNKSISMAILFTLPASLWFVTETNAFWLSWIFGILYVGFFVSVFYFGRKRLFIPIFGEAMLAIFGFFLYLS